MTTRAQLRTSVRIAADQDLVTSFPTDVAVNDFIDRAARTIWRRMLAAGWKPDRTSVTINTNGAASYTVGSDVSMVHSVQYVGTAAGNSFRQPLSRVKPESLADLLASANTVSGSPATYYDLIGGGNTALTIEFYPTPTSGTYEVRYTRKFPGFASDADTWFGPDGSDELIILTSAIDCVNKEGDPADMARVLQQRLQDRWSEVLETAGWMDSQGQQTVRNANRVAMLPYSFNVSEAWDE